jgi:peroxiredoxin
MKKNFFITSMMVITLTNFSCKTESVAPVVQAPNTPQIGVVSQTPVGTEKAINFTLNSDGPKDVTLEDYKNNVVVLFFFGNGCSSCKATAPTVESTFVSNYVGKKVQVIGLDTWDGNLASVKAFKSASSLSFPLLLQASGVAKTLETTYDRIMVVDKKGIVRFKGTNLANGDIANAQKVVDEYLAKQ